MSLTSQLAKADSAARLFIQERFPRTQSFLIEPNRALRSLDTARPSGPISYSTVGTAFDYRLRFYFASTPSRRLMAAQGADLAVATGQMPGGLCASFFRSLDSTIHRFRR